MLSAGLLALGAALLVLRFAAPALIAGTGLAQTDGPRWARILVPLAVGLLGELRHRWRERWPARLRLPMAALVVLAGLLALWWGWWR